MSSRIVRTARETPVLILCGSTADGRQREALAAAGCEVAAVREVEGRLWLPAVTEALVMRGITRLLVEGGPTVWRAFAEAGFVDEAIVFRGGSQPGDEPSRFPADLLPGLDLVAVAERRVGEDAMMVFRRRHVGRQ